jgi:glycosyltransferase involved in cell wall biosynthesis
MASRGHTPRVLLHQGQPGPYYFEGVQVFGPGKYQDFGLDAYRWGDVICTHLDFTPHSINMGRYADRPVINFVHNSTPYQSIMNAKKVQYLVYNSRWIENELSASYEGMPGTVLYPPCQPERCKVDGDPGLRKYVTLININENKGGYVLAALAKEMPNVQFLAVIGSYDDGGLRPDIIKRLEGCPNVTLQAATTDIMSVYRQTRILLVPSRYESWGRVATEAMINGIPVLACPTAGLMENCGSAAWYITPRGPVVRDREGQIIERDEDYDLTSIITAINLLDNSPEVYNQYSFAGVYRAFELEQTRIQQLDELANFFQYAIEDFRHNSNR